MRNFAPMKSISFFLVIITIMACNSNVRVVKVDELKGLLEKGGIQLVELRNEKDHNDGFIPNSNLYKPDVSVVELANQLYPNMPVVLYADHDSFAHKMALELKTRKFENVSVMEGGFEAWKKAGNKFDFKKLFLNDTIPFAQAMTMDKLIMVDFNAVWCAPCKMLEPAIKKARTNFEDVFVYGIDTDENTDLAMKYNASSIPLLVFIKNGVEVHRTVGLIPYSQIETAILKYK